MARNSNKTLLKEKERKFIVGISIEFDEKDQWYACRGL